MREDTGRLRQRCGRAAHRFRLDFAVAVADDGEAEGVVHRLQSRDYAPVEILEQDYVKRLSGVRMAHAA